MFSRLVGYIRRQPVTGFYLLAFGISWTCLIAAYVILQDSLFLAWIGSFGPAIAGLFVTGVCASKPGLEQMLARLVRWRVPWASYLFVIGVGFLAAGTVLLHDGPHEMLKALQLIVTQLPFLLGLLLLLALLVMGEEIGWRRIRPAAFARAPGCMEGLAGDWPAVGNLACSSRPRSGKCTQPRAVPLGHPNFYVRHNRVFVSVYLAVELHGRQFIDRKPFPWFL